MGQGYRYLCLFILIHNCMGTLLPMSAVKTRPALAYPLIDHLDLQAQKYITPKNCINMVIIASQLALIMHIGMPLFDKLLPYHQRRDWKLAYDIYKLKKRHAELRPVFLGKHSIQNENWRFKDLIPMIEEYDGTPEHLQREAIADKLTYQTPNFSPLALLFPLAVISTLPYLTLGKAALEKLNTTLNGKTNSAYHDNPEPDDPEDPNKFPLIIKLHLLMMALGIANSYVN